MRSPRLKDRRVALREKNSPDREGGVRMESEEMIRSSRSSSVTRTRTQPPAVRRSVPCESSRSSRKPPYSLTSTCTRTTLSFAARVAAATNRLSNERTPGTPVGRPRWAGFTQERARSSPLPIGPPGRKLEIGTGTQRRADGNGVQVGMECQGWLPSARGLSSCR
jgi:hypothetical protein